MSNGSVPPERDRESPDGEDKPPRARNYTGVILVVLIIAVCFLVFQNTIKGPDPITFPAFQNYLLEGKVEKVSIEKNKIKFTVKKDDDEPTFSREQTVIAPQAVIADNASLLEEMAELGEARAVEEITDQQVYDYIARVVHGEAAPLAIYRRIILESKKEDRLQLLVKMTRPPSDQETIDVQAAPGVFLLEPRGSITISNASGVVTTVDLTWKDLLFATAGTRNRELALPDVSTVTTTVPTGVIEYDAGSGFLETLLIGLAPWLIILLFFWFFILRQMRNSGGIGGNILSFGRSRARIANREKTQVTFADVEGIEEAKEEVAEVVEFLKHPGRFSRLGGRTPRGVLLIGPPGNGKTLLAKAIAGEADVPFYSICGSDFVEMFVGVGAARVRDLFKQARENSPCLIFLDELDAVGRRRGAGLGGGHDEREQTLNAILVEMDGFETDGGVIVIAATNRADVLDPALLRPGRFDREILVDLPDMKGRQAILGVHAKKVKMHPSVDLEAIAKGTPGFSGAELEAVINEAAIIAVMGKKDAVFGEDLEEARDRVRFGRAKRSQILDEEDKKVTAYHEAGHTVMAWIEPKADSPHKVTIIPRGHALGATMTLPAKDHYGFSAARAEARLRVLMGGRAAEKLFFNEITSGAANDIKVATDLATHMVREWGMSAELGPICYAETEDTVFLGRDMGRGAHFSEATVELIDKEVKRILKTALEDTVKTIELHREKVELIARNLLDYETLTSQEIDGVLEGDSVEEVRRRVEEATKAIERRAMPVIDPKPELPPPAFEPPGPLAGEGAT